MKKAPTTIGTERLRLQRPESGDARAIFDRYASDAEVAQYLAWPRHYSIRDTQLFLDYCDAEWKRWPAGPYLIFLRDGDVLLGSTGIAFETPGRASTGYVLARDAWGKGYATEALKAMRDVAGDLGIQRLYACCHIDHTPSRRVLEKGGFTLEGTLRRHTEFPNLNPGRAEDVASYAWIADGAPET